MCPKFQKNDYSSLSPFSKNHHWCGIAIFIVLSPSEFWNATKMVTASKPNSTNMPILQNISENMVGWHYLNYFNCFAINHNMHQLIMFSGLFCELQFKVTELLHFNILLSSLHVSQHLTLWGTDMLLKFIFSVHNR